MKLSFIQDENAVETIDGITYDFPYTMHERDLGAFTVPWHWHEEVEFDYAYRGSIEIETMTKTYRIQQGEAYFINTNVMNTKRRAPGSDIAIEHAHLFHPLLLAGHYKSIFETKYMNPILKDLSLEVLIIKEDSRSGKEFLKVLQALTRLRKTPDCEFEIRSLLSRGWKYLMEEIGSREETQKPLYVRDRSRDMLSYLHKHYSEKISVADLAARAGVSERECIRSFKNVFHRTPMEYLICYRIEQAKRLLAETEESITDIAFMTGFQSSAYFAKTFRKLQGITPKEFRQARREEQDPDKTEEE